MAHAMAKLAVLFCIALLVAHVDSARTLKEDVTGDIMTASTHDVEESSVPAPADDSAVPSPDTEYNYATEEATAEEPIPEEPATEDSTTEDSTTEDSTTEDSATEFASGGFLVPSPPLSETEDQGTQETTVLASDENTDQEGTLWQPEEEGSDDATAASFAVETTTDDDSSTPPYDFDATTQDADSVYPEEAVADSFASQFETQDSGSEETTEPEFAYDESTPIGYGN